MKTLRISIDTVLPLNGNTLLMGPTGAGKTVLLDRLVVSALDAGMDVFRVDEIRRGDRVDPRVRYAQNLDDALALLKRVHGEVACRTEGDLEAHAPVILFVDGLAGLTMRDGLPEITGDPDGARRRTRAAKDNRRREAIERLILRILREGPKVGVFTIADTQRALDLYPAIRARFDSHVLLGYVPDSDLRVLLGEEGTTRAFAVDTSRPGDGVLCVDGRCLPFHAPAVEAA